MKYLILMLLFLSCTTPKRQSSFRVYIIEYLGQVDEDVYFYRIQIEDHETRYETCKLLEEGKYYDYPIECK